jgi:serine O-acetyltransferase
VFKHLREDIDSVMQRDPAAKSRFAVLMTYPGLHAILAYRVAHGAWIRGWRTFALWLSYVARIVTGIEIHPAATIGRRFFIDHGTGVVIGETAEIGNDVTLYQGVTLGGTTLNPGKRHPTLEDGVIVGAGAKVLGPFTVGAHARIGSNAVVVNAVPPGATMVGIPAKPQRPKGGGPRAFLSYGTDCDQVPEDPLAIAVREVHDEVKLLRRRIDELEHQLAEARGSAVPVSVNGAAERPPVGAN